MRTAEGGAVLAPGCEVPGVLKNPSGIFAKLQNLDLENCLLQNFGVRLHLVETG